MVAAITSRARAEVDAADVDRWILPSAKMTPAERLDVYRSGYVARLEECLEDDYPVVAQTLGEGAFRELVEAYLGRHPSNGPNLNFFGRHMAALLRDRGEAFLSELAALEWALVVVLHAETPPPMDLAALQTRPPEDWERARFVASDAVRLLRFEHPVNAYFQAVRVRDESPDRPAPAPSAVAVYRKDLTLWRMDLTPPMVRVLAPLLEGKTFGEALAGLEVGESEPETEALAEAGRNVMVWFRDWVEAGFFARVDFG
jgi:hypothetical protein